METNKTDKNILVKGLKKLGTSAICMFLGPTLLYVAKTNQEKPLYIPLLILSIIISITAIFFAFKGIQTIMKSLFNKPNSY